MSICNNLEKALKLPHSVSKILQTYGCIRLLVAVCQLAPPCLCSRSNIIIINWASSRENLSSVVCEQQRRRPACASAQSDQRLCFSRFGKYHIQTCYKPNFNFLAGPCNWEEWFESRVAGNPEDRFSRDVAQPKKYCIYPLLPDRGVESSM